MDRIGAELDSYRRSLMLGRQLGLTKLYNLVHDERVTDPEIRRLREIHVEIDEAVTEAYGWSDLTLGHGFHETRQGVRFTIDPAVQIEVLDRLLELNHQRYSEEGPKGASRPRRKPPKQAKNTSQNQTADDSLQPALDGGLFRLPDALF
jgi:hypothetical protein